MEDQKIVAGVLNTPVSVDIRAAYENAFEKDGQTITYYRAFVPVKKGLKEVAITDVFYEEIKDSLPATFDCTAVYDLNFGKFRLDTLH